TFTVISGLNPACTPGGAKEELDGHKRADCLWRRGNSLFEPRSHVHRWGAATMKSIQLTGIMVRSPPAPAPPCHLRRRCFPNGLVARIIAALPSLEPRVFRKKVYSRCARAVKRRGGDSVAKVEAIFDIL